VCFYSETCVQGMIVHIGIELSCKQWYEAGTLCSIEIMEGLTDRLIGLEQRINASTSRAQEPIGEASEGLFIHPV